MLGSNARTGKQDIVFPKLDWQINSKNRASFEVNRMRWASPYGVQTQVTNTYSNGAAFGNDYVSDTWGVGKLDSFFSPTSRTNSAISSAVTLSSKPNRTLPLMR